MNILLSNKFFIGVCLFVKVWYAILLINIASLGLGLNKKNRVVLAGVATQMLINILLKEQRRKANTMEC